MHSLIQETTLRSFPLVPLIQLMYGVRDPFEYDYHVSQKHKKKGMLFNSIHQIEKLNHTKNTKKLLSFTGNYLSFSFS